MDTDMIINMNMNMENIMEMVQSKKETTQTPVRSSKRCSQPSASTNSMMLKSLKFSKLSPTSGWTKTLTTPFYKVVVKVKIMTLKIITRNTA